MEEIQNTFDTFDRLRKYQYKITVENGMEIVLRFSRAQYHHLAGFQHLTDLDDVANPRSKQEFYNKLKNGNISVERIKKSCQYDVIRERIESFGMIEEILAPGEGKIIVEFDRRKADSLIQAKFHLYRRKGDPFKGEVAFFTLFIDRKNSSKYYPATYIVEHSNMYVREQTLYDCNIERQLIGGKKALVGV